MDIIDYELYRSGRYMPATVTATYSFVDKVISSFGGSIAPLLVGLIGYTTVAPQVGDPLTMPLKIMTVILAFGFPIAGWICTIVAMRKSELSREKMIEVAKVNAERKAAQHAAEEV
jgi:Na+/melibiose symporter-like transporter